MILDAIILVVSAILLALFQVFNLITFIVPNEINEAFITAFNGIGYFNAYFPFTTLFNAGLSLLSFQILLWTWRIIKWAYAHIPWIGKHHKTPEFDS